VTAVFEWNDWQRQFNNKKGGNAWVRWYEGDTVESDQTSKNGNYVWWDGETFGVGVVSRDGS